MAVSAAGSSQSRVWTSYTKQFLNCLSIASYYLFTSVVQSAPLFLTRNLFIAQLISIKIEITVMDDREKRKILEDDVLVV